MLDAAQANAKTAALSDMFAEIGVAGDTKMPRAKLNTEPAAWEVFVSGHLLRIAEARKKKAVRDAIKLGVMFDHEKQAMVAGTEALIYAGDVVEISVSVTSPGTKVDMEALGLAIVKAGVKLPAYERMLAACTSENRPPHKFVASLITKRT